MTYNENRKKSSMKYAKANLKRIPLDVPLSKYDEIKAFVESHGETVNGFIKRAIQEAMDRDKQSDQPNDEQ